MKIYKFSTISPYLPKRNANLPSNNRYPYSNIADSISFSSKNLNIQQNNECLPHTLKEALDNEIFVFEKSNGKNFKGTIREYFSNSILDWSKDRMRMLNPRYGGVFHNTYLEDALNIINSGLDYTKTSRVQAGPGTYFSPYQDLTYGNISLNGVYVGKMEEIPVFEDRFYEPVLCNSSLIELVGKYADSQKDITQKINKYCHDLLVDDMGIDVLYCATKRQPCYVAFNDKTMKLSPYNFKIINGKLVWN